MQLRFAKWPPGMQAVGVLQLPQPRQKGPDQVYAGAGIKFVQTVAISKDITPRQLTIQGKLDSQGCNDDICYPPVTEMLETVITVIP